MDKIFGIGLNKTGTTTLKYALKKLGFRKTVGCEARALKLYRLSDFGLAKTFVRGPYDNYTDWPWPLMYEHLHKWCPDAYFILTVRKDAEIWYNSLRRHVERKKVTSETFKRAYGYEIEDREMLIKFYEVHNRNVRKHFKNNKRFKELCWDAGDGWTELCSLFGTGAPDKEFPWRNKADG